MRAASIRLPLLAVGLAVAAVIQCVPALTVMLTGVPTGTIQSAVTNSPDVQQVIEWTVVNGTGPYTVVLSADFDGDGVFKSFARLAQDAAGPNTFHWFPPNRPTPDPPGTMVRIRIEVRDAADPAATATHTDGAFRIVSNAALPPGSTTLRDFDQPGTQPIEHGRDLATPSSCRSCHSIDNPIAIPGRAADKGINNYVGWIGTMMAQASIDPLFEACLEIANQDAPESGDLCIRCHTPMAWLSGRSTPTDHSLAKPAFNHAVALSNQAILTEDKVGVFCEHCHRLVDATLAANANGDLDARILAKLGPTKPTEYGNGMYVIDPEREVVPETAAELGANEPDGAVVLHERSRRRGPIPAYPTQNWVINKNTQQIKHRMITSVFNHQSEQCGTCHDVSNPAIEWNGTKYAANTNNAPATNFSVAHLMPIERTFSEWKASTYAGAGVSAPVFDTAKNVKVCQDCHMRDVANGIASDSGRQEPQMSFHDLTGGNTFIPAVLRDVYYQGSGNVQGISRASLQAALTDTIERAQYMLRNAATVEAKTVNAAGTTKLRVRLYNETGHKLPTGYPEGRRMWVNVKFLDADSNLLTETNRYDPATAVLSVEKHGKKDPESRVYEAKLGIDDVESFHFVRNNKILKDNRIPPRGFDESDFDQFGGKPVGATYADGQFWDDSDYAIPGCAAKAVVTAYYQTASREYVEFLRDKNTLTAQGKGAGLRMYELWRSNGKSTPQPVGREVGTCADSPVNACSPITATLEPGVIGCIEPADCNCGSESCTGTGSGSVEVSLAAAGPNDPPQACSAVSRKSHAGTEYDVNLSNGETEPRFGGPTRVLVRFDKPLKPDRGSVNVIGTSNPPSWTTAQTGPDIVDITLTNVTDGQCLTLSLTAFEGTNDQIAPNVGVPIVVKLGDVGGIGDGVVQTSPDLADAQDLSGLLIAPQTFSPPRPYAFRHDVNLSGGVTAADLARISNAVDQTGVSCP